MRLLETALKDRFILWMKEDKEKIGRIFERLETEIHEEFEKRSKPFDMVKNWNFLYIKYYFFNSEKFCSVQHYATDRSAEAEGANPGTLLQR